jgi:hypothetical protein
MNTSILYLCTFFFTHFVHLFQNILMGEKTSNLYHIHDVNNYTEMLKALNVNKD